MKGMEPMPGDDLPDSERGLREEIETLTKAIDNMTSEGPAGIPEEDELDLDRQFRKPEKNSGKLGAAMLRRTQAEAKLKRLFGETST